MLSRNSRSRPINAPAAFIHPCHPIVAKQPPTGPGWAYKLGIGVSIVQIGLSGGAKKRKTWAGISNGVWMHFRVYYQHDYPH
jgi:hypothetical protein